MEATESTRREFHVVDYVVFGVVILISLGIGVFHAFMGRRKNNTDEYLVGGRSMGFLPTAISLVASFESSIMMLGLPAEAYLFGLQYVWWIVGNACSQLLAINVVVPLLHPLRITSAYEYLEMRFNSKAVRLLGTALGTLSYLWYMGIVLYGPATALEAVSDLPIWNSMLLISAVAIVYTSIGGIRAVIWTDVFQGVIMIAGVFAILIQGTIKVGGPRRVWDTADAAGRMNFFNFDLDPRVRHTFWNLFLGSILRGFSLTFNQSTVQRISSTRTIGDAKRMLWIMAPCFFISVTIATYEGIIAFSYYQTEGCDPIASGKINNPNQLIPYTVMDLFESLPGLSGLFLASLFSASLSTLSSGLSSTAALAWTDVIHPLLGDVSDNKSTIIIKLSVVVFGAIACGVSFLVAEIGGVLTQIAGSLISSFAAPLTGIFFLGCFFPRTNAMGAIIGGILGMGMCIWISMGQSFSPNIPDPVPLQFASTDNCYSSSINGNSSTDLAPTTLASMYMNTTTTTTTTTSPQSMRGPSGIEHLYTISYSWISAIGVLVTMIVGIIVSFITGFNRPGDVNPRYLLSATDAFLFFLPRRVRRYVSSIGPQYMAEKYRKNFSDPIEAKSEKESKPRVTVISDEPVDEHNGRAYDLQQTDFHKDQDPNSGVENGGFSRL